MAKPVLSASDFERAAQALNCDVAAIKSVCKVEAPHGGFLPDDRPTILFERHKFYKYTGGKSSPHLAQSDICNPKAGGYGAAGDHQWVRFSKAFALDKRAAMLSCSWGKFQIMGFNFALAGFNSLDEFVDAMKESEGRQLDAFVNFVIKTGLAGKLRRHDWPGFALGYNGENYHINAYDKKLAAAHRLYSKQESGEPEVGASLADVVAPVEVDDDEVADAAPEAAPVVAADSQRVVTTPTVIVEKEKPADTPPPDKIPGITASKIGAGLSVGGVVSTVGTILSGAKKEIVIGLVAVLLLAALVWLVSRFWYANKAEARKSAEREAEAKRAHEITMAKIASAKDKDSLTVEVAP